jgi:hypothetical protein
MPRATSAQPIAHPPCGGFSFAAGNALLFSVLGGALLTRYLLPMYPLVLLVAVPLFYRRVPYWQGWRVFGGGVCCRPVRQPSLRLCPGRQPGLRRVVRMHVGRHRPARARYPGATVLTAWPMTDELTRPELGYLKQPWDEVYRIEDFTAPDCPRRRRAGKIFGGAGFSTKYDPPVAAAHSGCEEQATGRALLRSAPRSAAGGDCTGNWAARWFGSRKDQGSGLL